LKVSYLLCSLLLLPGIGESTISKIYRLVREHKHLGFMSFCELYELIDASDLLRIKRKDALLKFIDHGELLVSKYNEVREYFIKNKITCNLYDENEILFLYSSKDYEMDTTRRICIVGTRKSSIYGKNVAKFIVQTMPKGRYTIVSGLAGGIDTYVLEAAAEFGHRFIICSPFDYCYTVERYERLVTSCKASGGMIMTREYPGIPTHSGAFIRRNQLMASISDVIIVVEAPRKSGALITAEFARKYNKRVYYIPGSIFSTESEGCNLSIDKYRDCSIYSTNRLATLFNKNMDNVNRNSGILAQPLRLLIDFLYNNPGSSMQLMLDNVGISSDELQKNLTILEIEGIVSMSKLGLYSIK